MDNSLLLRLSRLQVFVIDHQLTFNITVTNSIVCFCSRPCSVNYDLCCIILLLLLLLHNEYCYQYLWLSAPVHQLILWQVNLISRIDSSFFHELNIFIKICTLLDIYYTYFLILCVNSLIANKIESHFICQRVIFIKDRWR